MSARESYAQRMNRQASHHPPTETEQEQMRQAVTQGPKSADGFVDLELALVADRFPRTEDAA